MSRAAAVAAPPLVHPTARFDRRGLALLAQGVVFLLAMAVALAVLLHYVDHFWWAPGEGAQALLAERLAAGAFHEVPAGAVHWVNALAFKVFGVDLVSLRYPLLALSLVQSALVFWLLAGRGVAVAFAAALALSCLTFVQFLAPAPQWYALFICLLLVAVLSDSLGERRGGLELAGFLLAVLFLFQPTSGVFALMGVVTCLLLQEQRHPGRERAVLARGLVLAMFAALALYLRAEIDIFAAALFGAAPLALLGTAFFVTRLSTACVVTPLLRLAVGGVLALAPIFVYHLSQGSLAAWGGQLAAAFAAPAVFGLAEGPDYAEMALQSSGQLFGAGGAASLNGVFWLALLALPSCLGLLLLRALWRGAPQGRTALPVVACFFALVSARFEAPLALYFSTALTLTAVLFIVAAEGRRRAVAAAAAAIALVLIGLGYQAGQPLSRGGEGIVAGRSKTVVAPLGLPRAGLTVPADEAALYGLLVNLIERHSEAGEAILALPANPELAFLSGRESALGLLDAAQHFADPAALRAAETALSQNPPRLVVYRPGDAVNTPQVERLAESLLKRYSLVEMVGGFALYRLTD